MPQKIYLEYKEHFLSLNDDGESLELVGEKSAATAFDPATAEQVIEILVQNGVDREEVVLIEEK